jgi:hypothetical protein
MASTTEKPSMTLPRKRNVGSFSDTDCEPTRRLPSLHFEQRQTRKPSLPDPLPIIRAESIRVSKFAPKFGPAARRRSHLLLALPWLMPSLDWASRNQPQKAQSAWRHPQGDRPVQPSGIRDFGMMTLR